MENLGAYGSSKAALTYLAKNLAIEEAKSGVRVNVVSPGAVVSDMLRGAFKSASGGKDDIR